MSRRERQDRRKDKGSARASGKGPSAVKKARAHKKADARSASKRMQVSASLSSRSFDPTTVEIYRALYTSVAEEMGLALRRTAFSPNIKERRDYSCAVFDAEGCVI